ncbi:MAG: protoglobin domain-containing protein [Thermodesulfobacteriota bacterium]
MIASDRIKAHYHFTGRDIQNLSNLKPLMLGHRDEFVVEFYNHVKNFEEAHNYLKDEATVRRHQDALKVWFIHLFDGDYGGRYFEGLERVGMKHVDISLPAHYVNAAFHFVKQYIYGILHREFTDPEERHRYERSVEKIININLDVFTSSYIEEEKNYFLSHRVESHLIQLANRFSYGLNLILVIGLVVLGGMVIGLFGYDLYHILDGELEKGLLSTLGSLLMLWVVIELMDTEIKHLRGGKFAVKVFVSVALVAVIRKILVASLQHEAVEAQVSLIAAVAVLGVVYWLISKVEK